MINLRLPVEGGNEMSELKIPVGISDFSEIRTDGYYYIGNCSGRSKQQASDPRIACALAAFAAFV